MVAIILVKASNAQISKSLPAGLVAVVTGGTSGIGEAIVKELVKHAVRPKIYIVGRSQEAADGIIAHCQSVNPDGEYLFMQKSFDLLKNVAELVEEIKSKEKNINILVHSAGSPDLTKTITPEGLHRMTVVQLYARLLLTNGLLPLLRAAAATPSLARVVSVAAGSHESAIDTSDWQGINLSALSRRGHSASLATLSWQHLASQAPDVGFVNAYPGLVMTGALNVVTGVQGFLIRTVAYWFQRWLAVPIEESGARHLFLATSAAYKAKTGAENGVPVVEGLNVHAGVDDEEGSGVYSVSWDGEGPGEKAVALLRQYNEDGTAKKAWSYFSGEVERVLGQPI